MKTQKLSMSVEAVRLLVADCENGLRNAAVGCNKLRGEKLIREARRQDRERNDGALDARVDEMARSYREGLAALAGVR